MNFVKKSLMEQTRGEVGTLGRVGALLLSASNLLARPWRMASLSYTLVGLAQGLSQKLY